MNNPVKIDLYHGLNNWCYRCRVSLVNNRVNEKHPVCGTFPKLELTSRQRQSVKYIDTLRFLHCSPSLQSTLYRPTFNLKEFPNSLPTSTSPCWPLGSLLSGFFWDFVRWAWLFIMHISMTAKPPLLSSSAWSLLVSQVSSVGPTLIKSRCRAAWQSSTTITFKVTHTSSNIQRYFRTLSDYTLKSDFWHVQLSHFFWTLEPGWMSETGLAWHWICGCLLGTLLNSIPAHFRLGRKRDVRRRRNWRSDKVGSSLGASDLEINEPQCMLSVFTILFKQLYSSYVLAWT